MLRTVGTFCILSVVLLGSGPVSAAGAFALKSESIDLPTGDKMFAGAGSEVVNGNCLTCHSAGMVLRQPPLPKATWDGIVKKMVNVYKAPISDKDAAAIVDYLSNGPKGSN